MIAFMVKSGGVGLAAPQIGLLKRIFVMQTKSGYEVVINPIITPGRGVTVGQEGCLSVPGLLANVSRHEQVSMSYQTPKGTKKRVTLQGFRARVAPHELDHLNGKLFSDRLAKEVRNAVVTEPQMLGHKEIFQALLHFLTVTPKESSGLGRRGCRQMNMAGSRSPWW